MSYRCADHKRCLSELIVHIQNVTEANGLQHPALAIGNLDNLISQRLAVFDAIGQHFPR